MVDIVKVGSEFLVNTQTTGFQDLPSITGLSGGGFVATWVDYSAASGLGVAKAQLYSAAGVKVGSEFAISANPTADQSFPTVTSLAGGGFAVTWTEAGIQSDYKIKAEVFSASGAVVTPTALVNTATYESSSILVYPDAVGGHRNTQLDGHAATDTINDAGFINIMTGYFIQQYQGDPTRIYAVGFYNGGSMALRLSCTSANKITAVAPFIANLKAAQTACTPGIYFDAEKFMPPPGKKFSKDAIEAAWKFLMAQKRP